jgi:hypothetical protein
MNHFIRSFSIFCRQAQLDTFAFWAFPVFTIVTIWLLTVVGLKIFKKRGKLKTVFIANRAWIISSLITAGILISLICFWWSKNFFTMHHYQLSLLISLTIAMLIPVLCIINLRNFYTKENIQELTYLPKTKNQLDAAIVLAKRAFKANKVYFILPLFGFLFLFLYLYKGTNLISLVFDNSGSMTQTSAIDALSETFDNLQENNEIILATLNGPNYKPDLNAMTSFKELLQVNKSSNLNAGKIEAFISPIDAKNAVNQITGFVCCSPICESIWKTYLYIKENKSNDNYKNKLLIIITDGLDNYMNESLKSGEFFFNDEGFADFFPPEKVFIIDFSSGAPSSFMQLCQSSGCDIYPAENNKQDYLDALDNALLTFKNDWYLIYWTILIFALFSIIGLLIQPKKIV